MVWGRALWGTQIWGGGPPGPPYWTKSRRLLVVGGGILEDIVRELNENREPLLSLDPATFERLVAERIERMGYDVTLTGKTNAKDGGIDLIAVPKRRNVGSIAIAGQVKHHRRCELKTGREDVDRLLAWKDSPFRLGLLVTNTDFTTDARWAASEGRARDFIRLRNGGDVKKWLRGEFESPSELPTEIDVAPGRTIKLPVFGSSLELWVASRAGQ